MTQAKERVRLDSIDAPEYPEGCMSDAAKDRLGELILGKAVKIEKQANDNFGRTIAFVTTAEGLLVNKAMLTEGFADFRNNSKDSVYSHDLTLARDEALKAQRGIWSKTCTKVDKNCTVKGNIRPDTGTKIYHTPDCYNYTKIKINEKNGDAWFCSEDEAKFAGFTKSLDCP